VNIFFVNQPSNRKGDSDPPRPLGTRGYFGLLMVHPSKPPLPPSRTYHQPFNHHEYVKDFDVDAHVKVLKAAIIANCEIDDAKFIYLLNFTLRDTMTVVTIIWEIT
jgi:hypothetical protein